MSRSNICISFKTSAQCSKKKLIDRMIQGKRISVLNTKLSTKIVIFLANRQLTLIFLCGNENFYRRERDIQDYPDSHAGHTKHDHFYLSFFTNLAQKRLYNLYFLLTSTLNQPFFI